MLSFKISYCIIHKSNLNPYQKMFMVRPKIALFSPNRSIFNTRCQLVTPLIFQYLANTNSNLRSPPWQTQIRSVFNVEEGRVTLRAKVVLKLEYLSLNTHGKLITITLTTKIWSSQIMYRSTPNETPNIKMCHHLFHTVCPLSSSKAYMTFFMTSCVIIH